MNLALIAALAEDGTIGDAGKIPWHLSDDLKHFKRLTMGHAIIMGRKTYDSIGRPLPGRRNIVLSRATNIAGVECFASLETALESCRAQGETVAFVIGGAEIYRAALPLADTMHLTHVHRSVNGDTKFPDYDRDAWQEISRQDTTEYSFVEYRRRPVR